MKKLNVFLDIDNTLVCSVLAPQLSKIDSNSLGFEYVDLPSSYFGTSDVMHSFRVFLRPGLEEFLDFCFNNFNVSIFTHSDKKYAEFIINNVILRKPEYKIQHVLTRDDCDSILVKYGGLKDVRYLFDTYKEMRPGNVVLVDDLEWVKMSNMNNCVKIPAFRINVDEARVEVENGNHNGFLNVGTILYLLKCNYESGVVENESVAILMQHKN